MDALRSLAIGLALVAAMPVHADPVGRWRPYINEASVRFGIPATWIERVVRAESAGRTTLNGRPITSRAGAMGLMQLMPGTWTDMQAALELGPDPHDPRDNILAGAAYLRLMYDRFGYPGAFAAYNAGPARYAAYLANRRTLPRETQAYLASVAGMSTPRLNPGQVGPENPIFFQRSQPPGRMGDRAESASLFVPLRVSMVSSAASPP